MIYKYDFFTIVKEVQLIQRSSEERTFLQKVKDTDELFMYFLLNDEKKEKLQKRKDSDKEISNFLGF